MKVSTPGNFGVGLFRCVRTEYSRVSEPQCRQRIRRIDGRSSDGAFADAILIRPAVMFGPDDAFLTTILKLLGRFSIYPMFGRGLTRLQPAYVEDVADTTAFLPARERPLASCAIPAAAVVFDPLLSSMTETRKLAKNRFVTTLSKPSPAAMLLPPMKIAV
jgi:hypothetical protein